MGVYHRDPVWQKIRVTWRSLNQNLASSSWISLRSPWTLDIKHPTILWICMLLRKERLSLWLYAGTSWCLVTLYQAFSLRSSSFELAVDMNLRRQFFSAVSYGIFYPPSSLNTASLGKMFVSLIFPGSKERKDHSSSFGHFRSIANLHTLWQKLRHQVPKSWQKMFHFISHASKPHQQNRKSTVQTETSYEANPINKTEGQQFKPKLVTKQTPSTKQKVNSSNRN